MNWRCECLVLMGGMLVEVNRGGYALPGGPAIDAPTNDGVIPEQECGRQAVRGWQRGKEAKQRESNISQIEGKGGSSSRDVDSMHDK